MYVKCDEFGNDKIKSDNFNSSFSNLSHQIYVALVGPSQLKYCFFLISGVMTYDANPGATWLSKFGPFGADSSKNVRWDIWLKFPSMQQLLLEVAN